MVEGQIESVRQYCYALKYMKNQTREACLAAVEKFGDALRYVKTQTEDICLAAVKQNGKALKFVDDPRVLLLRVMFTLGNRSPVSASIIRPIIFPCVCPIARFVSPSDHRLPKRKINVKNRGDMNRY